MWTTWLSSQVTGSKADKRGFYRRKLMMKRSYLLGVLFFSGLWGVSEAVLGDALYRAAVPYASASLTAVAFVVLTFSRAYFPRTGTATLIAALAMLYKFLNAPFFACHLLGILLIGACYDLFFNVFPLRNRSFSAAAAAYLNYALFAVLITYVFQYDFWVQGGFAKVLGHIAIDGSIAALACAVLVPVSYRVGRKLQASCAAPFAVASQFVPGSVLAVTAGLWIFGVMGLFLHF